MTFCIRPATRDDEPFLWEILYHALYEPPGDPPLPRDVVQLPELARYVRGWSDDPDDLGVIAVESGRPIGAAWLRRLTGANRGYGYVDDETPELSIAVRPEYRGRGVGTRLL